MLHGIPTITTYEDTLQALEDRFGDQHNAAAYRCQRTSTQKTREPLQGFSTAIEQLAHLACPTLSEDHMRREAGKAFSYWVRDLDINILLLMGGEKTVSGAQRKALELHAVMVTARPLQNTRKTNRGTRWPLARREDAQLAVCWSLRNQVTSKVVAMDTRTRTVLDSHKETNEYNREDQNADRITTQKQVGTVANGREKDEGRRRRAHAVIYIKAAPLRANRHHKKTRH
jgi:hypothetical protein